MLTKRLHLNRQLCRSSSKSSSVCYFSGSSLYNVCTEEEDGENCSASQQRLENLMTMNKMKLLKAKMEDMNLNKKVEVRIYQCVLYLTSEPRVLCYNPIVSFPAQKVGQGEATPPGQRHGTFGHTTASPPPSLSAPPPPPLAENCTPTSDCRL